MAGNQLRDLVIGGNGADSVNGNDQQDIVIGSTTSYDSSDVELGEIMTEWVSTDTYSTRISAISTGVGTDHVHLVGSGPTQTVFADGVADTIDGGVDTDWYLAEVIDTTFAGGGETITTVS